MHEPLGTLSHKRHGTISNLCLSGYKILVREGCKRENVDIYFLETLLFSKALRVWSKIVVYTLKPSEPTIG